VALALGGCTVTSSSNPHPSTVGTFPVGASQTTGAPVATPAASQPVHGDAALQRLDRSGFIYQLPVKATERIADGAVMVSNAGQRPIQLVSVEPMFDAYTPFGTLLGVGVIARAASEDTIGIARTYPPPGDRLMAVSGATLEPASVAGLRYQLMVGLQVRDGTVNLTALQVTFTLDGHTYTRTLPHHVTLCEGRPAGSTTC
jgi:hypothetical protein